MSGAREGETAATVTVVRTPTGWTVVEDGTVVSHHGRREPAHKAALDWAGRSFGDGRRRVVILG